MEEKEIKSKKISLKKQFIIAWIIIAVILIVNIIINIIFYSNYKKGQDLAVTSLLTADELGNSNKFSSEDYKTNRKKTIENMYDYLNPSYYGVYSSEGRKAIGKAISEVEYSLEKILKNEGYDRYCTYYLKYTGFLDYYLYENIPFFVIYGIIFLIALIITVGYLRDRKTEIVVDGNMLLCRKSNGKTIKFLLQNITGVETTKLRGLKILGNGFKYKIILVKNNEEIKDKIMKLLSDNNKSSENSHNDVAVDELKKYKELLDNGTITQEEFDAKKKQLLNL